MNHIIRCYTALIFCVLVGSTMASCTSETSKSSVNKSQQNLADLIAPVELTVGEGFVNPLGYYEVMPRFSWKIPSNSLAKKQTAYQIQVASSQEFEGEQLVWDSGKVESNSTAWVKYQGTALQSRQQVHWRVKMWDEQLASAWSEPQLIELGLLNNTDWQAKWVGHPDTGERDTQPSLKGFPNLDNSYYRPQYIRSEFSVTQPVTKARLYVTAKGVFKPFINGKAVSEDVMTPGWTPYHKRIETLTYDVTELLTLGNNAIGAMLAEGWYTGRIFYPTKEDYVKPMRLLAQLEIVYQDGSKKVIASNDKWQSTDQGPIRAAGNYDGEVYDANFDISGWNTTQFNPQGWQSVYAETIDRQVNLRPKRHAAVRSTLTIPAVDIVSVTNGRVIFDMGQNMVGVPEINIPVKQGQAVKLRFSEALDRGEFYVKNLRSAKSEDIYIPNQDGEITYRPTFTFHGYRFVEISGFDTSFEPQLSWLNGQVLHSDFDVYDNFNTNHPKLNKLSDNVSWGLRGNFLDIPTDCPQRDERLGWTGDAQVFVSTSMYKADVYAFWAAWLESVREDQGIDGLVPKFVPFRPFLTEGTAAAWGDAATIVPWELYQYTGDLQVLADNYNMMQRWVSFTEFNSYDYISNIGTYGDWLQPYAENGSAKSDTNHDLIATAYYAHSVDIMAKSARLLGYESDAIQYELLLTKIKDKFRRFFYDENLNLLPKAVKLVKRENGKRLKAPQEKEITIKTTQTSYLLPLAFKLFSAEEEAIALEKLLALLEQSDRHLRTGFLGTPMLHNVLQRFGHSDVMYDILLKETYPSWFYSINHGATTTWERWDSYSLTDGYNKANMNSLNHYAYGAVAQWFYNGMLGISALEPGFKRFSVNPQFTPRINELKGSVPAINGDIKVSFTINQGLLSMSLNVPKNTTASLELPTVQGLLVSQQGVAVTELKHLQPGEYQISGMVEAK